MNAERLLAHYEKIADAPEAIVRLRHFILDLAVRGKLVPQKTCDEPASELLKHIAAEKAGLFKAGAIRRFDDPDLIGIEEQPFPIPHTWQWVRLKDVLTKLTDGTHHSPPNVDRGDFKYITAKNIKNDGVSLHEISYVSRQVHEEIYSRCNPELGDILYIKDGATTGIVTINDIEEPFSMLSSVALLKLPSCMCNRLIVEFLRSPFFYDQMRGFMKGAAIPRVTLKRMAPALIPLPPLAEQQRIVAKVDELMGLCDRLEAARSTREAARDRLATASLARLSAPDIETFQADARFAFDALPALTTRPEQIKQLRRTILNLAVRGKIVPQDASDPPVAKRYQGELGEAQFPPTWRILNFGKFCDIEGGNQPPKSQFVDESRVGYIRLFQIRDLGSRPVPVYIPISSARSVCKSGEILIGRYGASVGKVFWAQDGAYNVAMAKFVWPDDALIPAFAFLLLKSEFLQAPLLTATRSAQAGFNKGDLASIDFPLPPLAEQHRIVAKVDELMGLCDRLEASLTATATTRRRLLDALLAEALAPVPLEEAA